MPLSYYINYDSTINKFVFTNCSTIEVEPRSDPLASGVFWGLDPQAYSSIAPSGNLVYNVGTSRTSDFTLEQSGWIRSDGVLPPDSKIGFFTYLNQSYTVSGMEFINLKGASVSGEYWTTPIETSKFTVSSGGRLQFSKTGLYALKAGFSSEAGSVHTISFGSNTDEGSEGGEPNNPNFETTFTFRVSPDPSMPAVIPMNVTSTSNTYYFYITSTGTQLLANSFISINPVDEVYKITNPITVDTSPCKLNLSGNVAATSGLEMTLTPGSNIVFSSTGEYLMTGVVYLGTGYVSNVVVWESSNLVYDYDMRVQGRDPTFAFTMPLAVTDTTANYYMNITTTTTTTVLADSYFVANKIGVEASTVANSNVLPQNGLLFRPSTSTLTSPLNLVSDFTASGNATIITSRTTGVKFNIPGVFMFTGAICTADKVTSITFGPQEYNVSLGILPPYTFQIPIYISDVDQDYSISLTTDGSSPSPNIFSNTFISVYPIATTIINPLTKKYPYYDSVGTWAIKTADLKIGGQTIQSLTGEFIEIWNDLHVPYENQPGLTILTGKNDTSTINPPGRTYFVNLPFYFYGNPSLYLPLVALERHDVEVHVTFRNFSELTAISVNNPSLDATIITEYVYLSDPEINWFRRARLDYVITQCQYQQIGLLAGFQSAVFNLDFKNPIRELFFVVQPTNQLPYDYSDNAVLSFGLSFNGQDVFTNDTTDRLYTADIEPFNKYPNFPQRDFFMYTFTNKPTSPKPAGQINFSRIKQALLRLDCGGQAYLPAKELRIIGVNYNILRIADGLGGLLFNT